jgi:3-phosphoshikimate 1-carboxyvinyltransferase
MTRSVRPLPGPPRATVRVPGSKSSSNRALVTAALAGGRSEIDGLLAADDTAAMIDCLRHLGVTIEPQGDLTVVDGTGGHLPTGEVTLDARLSGTVSRFLLPVLALGAGRYRMDGQPPLRRRPMGPLVDALRGLGADVTEAGEPGCLPLVVSGGSALGDRVEVLGDVSSQFVSALMLVGACLPHGLQVVVTSPIVSAPFLDMTAGVMAAFGATCVRTDDGFAIDGTGYQPSRFSVEPDASSASYLFAAAAITGGRVRVDGLARDSTQGDIRFVDVLARMGADVEWGTGHTTVSGGRALRGIDVDLGDLPDMATTLAAVAVFADRPTTVRNVAIIRGHETDRINAVVTELHRCGIEAHEHDDGFTVVPGRPHRAVIQTYDDHRIAMSFALLGLVPGGDGIDIADPECVAKTFPDYFTVLDQLRGIEPLVSTP